MKSLSAERITEIHDDILQVSGGLPGLAQDKSLISAIHRIDNHHFYANLNELFDIAALYGAAIAQGHVFNDGNKRTAFMAMHDFLFINCFLLNAPENDTADIMVALAEKKISHDELAEWLKKNSTPQYLIIGLGKTGLSCARFLKTQGKHFALIDNRDNPPLLKEFREEFPEVALHLGGFDHPIVKQAAVIIKNPGVAPEQLTLNHEARVIGDIELFAQHAKAPIIAITGTNAKGTVTTLVGDMIKNAGLKVIVGGNIGVPALELLNEPTPDYYVLEISSFQLETTHSLKACAATILNLSEDHLDRHHTMENYQHAKQRIYQHCEVAVFNRDDQLTTPLFPVKEKISFGLDKPKKNQFGISDNYLSLGDKKLMLADELRIKGKHNWANALAALALGRAINLPMDAMLKTLKEFKGLPHRCEWVAEHHRVTWINDSKGTNVGATIAALEGLGPTISGKIILLAGGLGKGADFTLLKEAVKKYTSHAILFGQDATLIAKAINTETHVHFVETMNDAIKLAQNTAQPNDVVLLSPACASFDMFRDFEQRGDLFKLAVKEMTE